MSKNTKRGRPALYKTPEEMQKKVDEYFEKCRIGEVMMRDGEVVTDKDGNPLYTGQCVPTLSGLSLYLGFSERHGFANQKTRGGEFELIFLKARLRIEQILEELTYDRIAQKGAIFTLRHHYGWDVSQNLEEKLPRVNVVTQNHGAVAPDPDYKPHFFGNCD